MRFPRMVIPLSVALHALFNLGLNLIVVFIFVLASGIEPRLEWLELIPLIVLLLLFSTGVGMFLSAMYVRYRDMEPIWEVALQMLFYATPVIYVTSTFPDSVEAEAMANPLTAILTQARHVLIDPDAPTAATAIGGTARLLIPLARGRVRLGARILGLHARGAAYRRGALGGYRGRNGKRAERRHVAPLARRRTGRAAPPHRGAGGRAGRADRARKCGRCRGRGPQLLARPHAHRPQRRDAQPGGACAVLRGPPGGSRLAEPEVAAALTGSSVSVVIPVKDGEERLEEVLAAVRAQGDLELIVIDSGSRDNSREIARAAGADLVEIPPEEFGHGRTRNLGAERASGDLICFLTQDAVPQEGWLDAYRDAFSLDERVGAAFGPHLPFPAARAR